MSNEVVKSMFELTDLKVMVIDLSYYVFYRYYALMNYFKLSEKITDFTDITDNTEFLEKYKKIFEKSLFENVKKHLGVNFRNIKKKEVIDSIYVIFAKDCNRAEIWRNEIHPDYKKNRDHQKNGVPFDGRIFDYVINNVLPDLCERYSFIKIIESCRAEADDVAAVICRYMCGKFKRLIVLTNDHDYLQLLDYVDGIYNLQGTDLSKKAQSGPSIKNMYFKVLQGDPSDNISGIISKKKVKQLMLENDMIMFQNGLNELLSYINMVDYERNVKLINFEHIPNEIKHNIEMKIGDIFNI